MKPKSNKLNISSVGQLLKIRAGERPDKHFLFSESDGRKWTFSEFEKAVNRFANFLRRHNIRKGDVVSLLMPNSAEYIMAYFACWKIGALAGPVNSLLKADEINFVINNSEAKMLLFHPQFQAVIEEIAGRLPTLESVFMFGDAAAETKGFSDEFESKDSLKPGDEAIIIYTSGTTGKPKGCLLTHENLLANAQQIAEWLNFDERDRLLTVMPLFHMNAVSVTTMTALYAGASTVVSPKFSASKFWQIIDDYRITSFGSVATMLSMLLAKEEEARSEPSASADGLNANNSNADPDPPAHAGGSGSLRFAMCGSAPVPAEVLKKFEQTFGCLVIEGYGLSESTCRSTFNPPDETRRPGSCGKPIGNEMKIFDERDREVPNGRLGEIVLRGENVFKGYFKNKEATEKAFAGGWFHTGDIGYRDDEGFFYIADRKSDMIIRGGENIYPREIDELLFSHPAIRSAAVIGVPDELYGEEVTAFVVLKEGESASEEDLINFCRAHLADYKCPKTFHFVEDIPKGPTGKLLKRELGKLVKKSLKS